MILQMISLTNLVSFFKGEEKNGYLQIFYMICSYIWKYSLKIVEIFIFSTDFLKYICNYEKINRNMIKVLKVLNTFSYLLGFEWFDYKRFRRFSSFWWFLRKNVSSSTAHKKTPSLRLSENLRKFFLTYSFMNRFW